MYTIGAGPVFAQPTEASPAQDRADSNNPRTEALCLCYAAATGGRGSRRVRLVIVIRSRGPTVYVEIESRVTEPFHAISRAPVRARSASRQRQSIDSHRTSARLPGDAVLAAEEQSASILLIIPSSRPGLELAGRILSEDFGGRQRRWPSAHAASQAAYGIAVSKSTRRLRIPPWMRRRVA
jgi:hypothetical protein